MSHNVKITNIKVTNLSYVEAAVAELNEELGLNWTCEYNSTIRGWAGKETPVMLAIKTNTQYDIGFNDNKDGTFSPVYEDFCLYDLKDTYGADTEAKTIEDLKEKSGRAIGKLLQRINIITAECEAAQSGYTTQREYNEETGIMNLLVMN